MAIAISLLLSAILFPVFGRAREQARKSVCLSNLKQLGISLNMYAQDFDGRLIPAAADIGPGLPLRHWPQILSPYLKNRGFARCPSADYTGAIMMGITYQNTVDSPETPIPGGITYDYFYGMYVSYGYNYAYLSPPVDCPDGFDSPGTYGGGAGTCVPAPGGVSANAFSADGSGRGVNESWVTAPAQTVMLAESTTVTSGKPRLGYYAVRAPQAWLSPRPSELSSDMYGRAWARHHEMCNVLFADGHAKALKMDALAQVDLWRLKKQG